MFNNENLIMNKYLWNFYTDKESIKLLSSNLITIELTDSSRLLNVLTQQEVI